MALLTSATCGRAILARKRMSPGFPAPISSTANACFGRIRSTVNGKPSSLLRLLNVASVSPACAKMLAVRFLTVVLPLLPVIATRFAGKRWHHALASCASAVSTLGTKICGSALSVATLTKAATAPSACACASNVWPSTRSPLSATKTAPGSRLRVSLLTLCT